MCMPLVFIEDYVFHILSSWLENELFFRLIDYIIVTLKIIFEVSSTDVSPRTFTFRIHALLLTLLPASLGVLQHPTTPRLN